MTYRLARSVDLKSRYGRFVSAFFVYAFGLGMLFLAGMALFIVGLLVLDHFFGITGH
jgi:hypothetical protein